MLSMFKARHSGVSNPSLFHSFRGFKVVKPLSWMSFSPSDAYNSLEGVRL